MPEKMEWKVATHQLFTEILLNKETACLKIPLNIMLGLLRQVAQRATELNDLQMNQLMIRLGLYSISNPSDPEFNPDLCEVVLAMKPSEVKKEWKH